MRARLAAYGATAGRRRRQCRGLFAAPGLRPQVRVKKSRMEADLFSWRGRGSNEFFDGGEDLRELLVVFLLKSFDFASEIAIRIHKPAQLHECAHDCDVDFNGALRAKHARKHRNALFGKSIRPITCAAMLP